MKRSRSSQRGILRIDSHHLGVERRNNLDLGKRTATVTAAGMGRRVDDQLAAFPAQALQFGDRLWRQGITTGSWNQDSPLGLGLDYA